MASAAVIALAVKRLFVITAYRLQSKIRLPVKTSWMAELRTLATYPLLRSDAGLDDMGSGVAPWPPHGVSPVGAAPLPTTHHADSCSPSLS